MRQIISTALVAVIVSLLSLGVAGAMAQGDARDNRSVTPAAGVADTDTVDGRHAVRYTNKRGLRAGKLVATNGQGELPSNTVRPYWGFIKNKPGILADHRITWAEVANKPASLADGKIGWAEVANMPGGFADGVDDIGYKRITVWTGVAGPWSTTVATFSANAEVDVELAIVPETNGGELWFPGNDPVVRIGLDRDKVSYQTSVQDPYGKAVDMTVRARLCGTKAQLASVVKSAKVSISREPGR